MKKKKNTERSGAKLALGMVLGIVIGMAVGIFIGDVGIGTLYGVPFGAFLGGMLQFFDSRSQQA